jgi:hypothetical protein
MIKIRNSYDVYLAGPFFNDDQKERMDLAKSIILEAGLTVADPRELGPIIVDSAEHVKTPEFFAEIFEGNIEGMQNSFMMVASIDDKDTGTAFEMGWAYGTGMPLFSFVFNEGKTNVMLGQAVDMHLKSIEEFANFFKKYAIVIQNCDIEELFSLMAIDSNFGALMKAEADE